MQPVDPATQNFKDYLLLLAVVMGVIIISFAIYRPTRKYIETKQKYLRTAVPDESYVNLIQRKLERI